MPFKYRFFLFLLGFLALFMKLQYFRIKVVFILPGNKFILGSARSEPAKMPGLQKGLMIAGVLDGTS